MSKAGRNEMKRVAANFFNGAAVAVLAAGCIGPVVAEVMDLRLSALAVLVSAIMHAMALNVVGDVED